MMMMKKIFFYTNKERAIALMSRVFANCPGDWGSIPSYIILKTREMVLAAALLNTQHYKVRIKGKVEQSREWSSALPYTSVKKLFKRDYSGHLRLKSPNLLILTYTYMKIDNLQSNFLLCCILVLRDYKWKVENFLNSLVRTNVGWSVCISGALISRMYILLLNEFVYMEEVKICGIWFVVYHQKWWNIMKMNE